MSVRAIAQQFSIGSGTVVRVLKSFTRQSEPIPPQLVRGPVVVMPKANSGDWNNSLDLPVRPSLAIGCRISTTNTSNPLSDKGGSRSSSKIRGAEKHFKGFCHADISLISRDDNSKTELTRRREMLLARGDSEPLQ